MFCRKCGSNLPTGARFCKNCGEQLTGDAFQNTALQQDGGNQANNPSRPYDPYNQNGQNNQRQQYSRNQQYNQYNQNRPYQPPYQQPPYRSESGKGKAIAALVCGIIGVLGCSNYVSVILGVVSIVMACAAKREGYTRGLSTAGLVLGIVALSLGGLVLLARFSLSDIVDPYNSSWM